MTYLSLYRKWRPQNFEEVVGQLPIVQTLKNAIQNNRLAHAYLFSGPRGTGKTSLARILAKALNCEQGPTPQPCKVCTYCQRIRDGQAVDVVEIDAASNRGIDEIRDLRERVRYTPVENRYKVYIIDEVHMLTAEAFNALLKILEEPPRQVVFVLATTDIQRVPLTISSRCQRLDFRRLTLLEIKERLMHVALTERVTLEEKALDLIARFAEGSVRDALSLLDQLISFAGQKITADQVVLLLGTADEELLFNFGEALFLEDTVKVLDLLQRSIAEGRSVVQIARDLISHFRYLLHLKVGAQEILELTADYLEKLKMQAEKFALEKIKEIIRALSRAELDMKWHPHARLVLEISLLELLEGRQHVKRETQIETPIANDQRITKIKNHWKDILESVRRKSPFSYVSLQEGEPLEINGKGKLVVGFRKGYSFHKQRLEENKEVVEETLREAIGEATPIECLIVDQLSKEASLSLESVADFFGGKIVS